ncbi:alpha-hydroxy acid oxidase [Bosea sp. (in: a-proteobacteria)]|jgi:isopentenyl diphosphate isomerase/L-lactate dehydrogenase-like FMN-dependent dehydrogenase|uniref:alpha-hydroxy acid oxidase n=1 Tax=Bosea sp. (in: a-proteobacteria) TaxID=1871050 RepID=UPI002DDD9118|nr:alpha-hydroxy acid oxidase [Bosea sp. (in: a-proteobacteria)]HEV2508431.1 alpha-hydroxy acid oxidase [Bosea sp. (in: a-proteobacteria)]
MTLTEPFRTIAEIFEKASQALRPEVWDYLIGGSESEATLCRNRWALDSYEFVPRVLRDVSTVDLRTSLLGRQSALPVFLAPVGSLRLFDHDAAVASATVAAAAGVPMFMSIMAEPSLEAVRQQVPKVDLILQLYMRGGRDWLDGVVQRAEEAGCVAICLTVDTAVYGRRERDLRNRFSPATAVDRANLDDRKSVQIVPEQASLSWETVAWLRQRTRLPLIIKGVMTAEDASLCADHGVDVVYVSNHGGRQLDHSAAAIDQLAEIFPAVTGRCSVFIDGGMLRGTDVLKAIALGADGVGLGKAQGAALAAGGSEALQRLIQILTEEIATALALLGCSSLSQLGPGHLRRSAPVQVPTVLSTLRLPASEAARKQGWWGGGARLAGIT